MNGTCPFCSKQASFRELTFMENVSDLVGYGLKWLGKPTTAKVSEAVEIGTGLASDREGFQNYKCNSCGGQVHTCGGCKAILPYQETGAVCPHCGYR